MKRFTLILIVYAIAALFGSCKKVSTSTPATTPCAPSTGFIGNSTETPVISFTNGNALRGWVVDAHGNANNINLKTTKVTILSYTNCWYGPYFYTGVCPNGSWTFGSGGYGPGTEYMVLLVDSASYRPTSSANWYNGKTPLYYIWNPSLDTGVLAWTMYPLGQVPTTCQ